MAKIAVVNLYVGNQQIEADINALSHLDLDVLLVCEAWRWWRELNALGQIHTGDRDGRKALHETGIVTHRVKVHDVRQVKLSDETGRPAGQERFAIVVRCELDGIRTSLVSIHLSAALGYDANMAAHQRGLRRIVALARLERINGWTPVVGGDFNDRGRTKATVLASEAFDRIDLTYRFHRLDGLAFDAKVWRVVDRERIDRAETGSDHDWLVFDLQPRTRVPETPEVPEEEEKMDRFVPYEEWSPYARGATTSSHPIGETYGVTFHWEGPHMGAFDHDVCRRKVQSIQRFHRAVRGWADIAYNAVVCPHGTVFEGRGVGVDSAANGYESVNDDWYAVCYLGGEGDGLTDAGWDGMVWARDWLVRHGAGPRVNGHRDHKATACPGPEIYARLNDTDWEATRPREENDMPEPKDVWDVSLPEYDDKTKEVDRRPARVLLAQAHHRAADARQAANRAARVADRCEAILRGLASALGPEVKEAVEVELRKIREDNR